MKELDNSNYNVDSVLPSLSTITRLTFSRQPNEDALVFVFCFFCSFLLQEEEGHYSFHVKMLV